MQNRLLVRVGQTIAHEKILNLYCPHHLPAALSFPLSRAPCAVEKKFGEVASPAKNSRPSTGAASNGALPGVAGQGVRIGAARERIVGPARLRKRF